MSGHDYAGANGARSAGSGKPGAKAAKAASSAAEPEDGEAAAAAADEDSLGRAPVGPKRRGVITSESDDE